MISQKDFWNYRATTYDQQVGPMYRDAYDQNAALARKYLQPGDKVLEFACGTGILTFALAPHVAHIKAIDISPVMVEKALTKGGELRVDNVDISHLDLFDPSLDGQTFDAVMAFNVLCYLDNFDEVMARVHALLKPGGMFLTATDCLGERPTRVGLKKWFKSRTRSMPYVAFFTRRSLTKKVEDAGFQVLEAENLFPSPPNLFLAARG